MATYQLTSASKDANFLERSKVGSDTTSPAVHFYNSASSMYDSDSSVAECDASNSSADQSQQTSQVSTATSSSMASSTALAQLGGLMSQNSIVDNLLAEIYHDPFGLAEASTGHAYFTACSAESSAILGDNEAITTTVDGIDVANQPSSVVASKAYLESKDIDELLELAADMKARIDQLSRKLVSALKRKNKSEQKVAANCELITATLQAFSEKRREDSQLRFTLLPNGGEEGFLQWKSAYQAVAGQDNGLPVEWRERVWLAVAEYALADVDWPEVKRFTFNDKSNPDDDNLGIQIVKDLHRTGCSNFCGQDAVRERAILKRVLLGYARWNKSVGYCQGFNILAAVLLQVLNNSEEKALKVMIFLVDHLLPANYFTNNLSTLQADMVAFRIMLKKHLPRLWNHLRFLQEVAIDFEFGLTASDSLISHEPPLTDVFTVQWFLTAFATCLPMNTVLRVWDLLMLYGSEVLFRVGLAVWGLLEKHLLLAENAPDFYSMMSQLSRDMLNGAAFSSNELLERILRIAPFPFPGLQSLCDNYRYNIHPLKSSAADPEDVSSTSEKEQYSEKDDYSEKDHYADLEPANTALVGSCFPSMATQAMTRADIQGILVSAHPALARVSPRQQPTEVKRPPDDVARLERKFLKRQTTQRLSIIRFDPLPLSRNIEPVKGHVMGRQRHTSFDHEKSKIHRTQPQIGAGLTKSTPLSTVLTEQQTNSRPFRSQHVVRPSRTMSSVSSEASGWSRSLAGPACRRSSSSGSGASRELGRGTSLHDVITSHHSSVLEGTDVEFSESALECTPVKAPRRPPSLVPTASISSSDPSPIFTTPSADSSPITPRVDYSSGIPKQIMHSEELHVATNSPVHRGPVVGKLFTTAEEDAHRERMQLAAHPDLLVCIDPHLNSGEHVFSAGGKAAADVPINADSVAAVVSRLEKSRSPFDQVRSGDRPDILRSLGSSSDEPNEAVAASKRVGSRECQQRWGNVDLTASTSSGEESTTGCNVPMRTYSHMLRHSDSTSDTSPMLHGSGITRREQSGQSKGSRPEVGILSSGEDTVVASSDSDTGCTGLVVDSSSSHAGPRSSKHKKKLMASVWQNHMKNLRRIQLVSGGESHSACSLNAAGGGKSLPSPSGSSSPSPVSGMSASVRSPRPNSSTSWYSERENVLPAALTFQL